MPPTPRDADSSPVVSRRAAWGQAKQETRTCRSRKRSAAITVYSVSMWSTLHAYEFHPKSLTDLDVILSHHPARAIARRLLPQARIAHPEAHSMLRLARTAKQLSRGIIVGLALSCRFGSSKPAAI